MIFYNDSWIFNWSWNENEYDNTLKGRDFKVKSNALLAECSLILFETSKGGGPGGSGPGWNVLITYTKRLSENLEGSVLGWPKVIKIQNVGQEISTYLATSTYLYQLI